MDFELPEELRILKDAVRRMVDDHLIPVERESCEGVKLKPEYREKFEKLAKDLGIWKMDVPEEYGGLGMGLLATVVVSTLDYPSPSSPLLDNPNCNDDGRRHGERGDESPHDEHTAATAAPCGEALIERGDGHIIIHRGSPCG